MIIYFDTETTGLYPGNICQLSYIMQSKEGVTAKNMYFSVDYVEYGALMVHGLSVPLLEKLSGGKCFADRVSEIAADFNSASIVASHNFSFDDMFLRAEFSRTREDLYIENSFCTMKKMTPYCKLPRKSGIGYKYPKLNEMCAFLGISSEEIAAAADELFDDCKGFHDARFDTAAVYLAANKAMDGEPMAVLKEFL